MELGFFLCLHEVLLLLLELIIQRSVTACTIQVHLVLLILVVEVFLSAIRQYIATVGRNCTFVLAVHLERCLYLAHAFQELVFICVFSRVQLCNDLLCLRLVPL